MLCVRLNSSLNLKIEELNAQLSCIYVEKLRLRTANVSLSVQLKQEREKTKKIMSESDVAVSSPLRSCALNRAEARPLYLGLSSREAYGSYPTFVHIS